MKWFSPLSVWTQVTIALKTCRNVRQVINQTVTYTGSAGPELFNFTVACADYTRCDLHVSWVSETLLQLGVKPSSNTQFTLNSSGSAPSTVYVTGVEYY